MDKTTFRRSFKLSLALLIPLALAVWAALAWDWLQAQRLPAREPDFRGRFVAGRGGQLLFESPRDGQWYFRPPRGERIRTRNDQPGALALGQTVSVWWTGPVRESYPPGADAQWIIIEEEPKDQPQ